MSCMKPVEYFNQQKFVGKYIMKTAKVFLLKSFAVFMVIFEGLNFHEKLKNRIFAFAQQHLSSHTLHNYNLYNIHGVTNIW